MHSPGSGPDGPSGGSVACVSAAAVALPKPVALPRLHVVAGDEIVGRPSAWDRMLAVLDAGGASLALHLRARRTTARRLHDVASRLVPVASEHGALLIVNDRLDVALAVGASGVHLREDSIPPAEARRLWEARRAELRGDRRAGDALGPALVGRSIHSPNQATHSPIPASDLPEETVSLEPVDYGAVDYFFLGAVYATASHPGRPPLGLDALSAAAERAVAPVVAIGGITAERMDAVVAAGAYGVAVVGEVWGARDPGEAVRRCLDTLRDGTGTSAPRP